MSDMNPSELEVYLDNVEFAPAQTYRQFLLEVLNHLKVTEFEISVTLCRDPFIRELNRTWRQKDEATDVLSFESDPERRPGCFGDLVISMDTLHTNSAYFCVDWQEELKRLSIHGMLHLMGWDHASNDASEPMLEYQERVLAHFKERAF